MLRILISNLVRQAVVEQERGQKTEWRGQWRRRRKGEKMKMRQALSFNN